MSEQAVRDSYARARQRWPDFVVPMEVFAAAARPALQADGAARPDAAAGLHGDDLYLVCAVAAGDGQAARAFQAHCGPAIEASMSRLGLERWRIEELRHQLVTHLIAPEPGARAELAGYSGRGSLRGWVGVVAWRFAAKRVRRARRTVAVGDDLLAELLAPDRGDAELEQLKRVYRAEFGRAFRQALQTLSARERNLMRQRYLDGVEVGALARMYGAHRVTVSRWISAAREAVAERTKLALASQLEISPSECESVMRLVNTHFDVSMSLLAEAEPPQ